MSENLSLPKLTGKIVVSFAITVKTGLHIGGSKSETVIGGIDGIVIKDAKGRPYIPGSSLKGKLRGLLAKKEGSADVKDDSSKIQRLFGDAGANDKNRQKQGGSKPALLTRLIVRDSFLQETSMDNLKREMLYDGFVEIKTENRIDRLKGSAKDPRTFERVPPGAQFNAELVYSIFDNANVDDDLKLINTALNMLELDYLGGSGTRGYGQLSFGGFEYAQYNISDKGVEKSTSFEHHNLKTLAEL